MTSDMEPISRDQMAGMCESAIEQEKNSAAQRIISTIYSQARITAMSGKKKYIHIQKGRSVGRISFLEPPCDISFESVCDYIMTELRRLFPGCKIEYVERHPTDIFDGRSRPVAKPNSDGIDRAIIVDWS
jgi:hypothetical protein